MPDLVGCPSCGTAASSEARLCPKCGAFMRSGAGTSRTVLIAFLVVAFLLGAAAVLFLG